MTEKTIRKTLSDTFALLMIVGVLAFIYAVLPESQESLAQAPSATDDAVWVVQMQDKVRSRLKDPNSATFSQSQVFRGFNNLPIVCGYPHHRIVSELSL